MLKLYTFAVNRPDFLAYQQRTFTRFLDEKFELIVINDGEGIQKEVIERECKNLGLICHNVVDQNHATANYAHARAIQFAYDSFIRYDNDISCLLDGDMFLGRSFSIRRWMDNCELSALKQGREHIDYMWPGICFMKMGALPDKGALNFWPDLVEGIGVDVGGHTYEYIKAHPEIRVRWMEHSGHITPVNNNMENMADDMMGLYNNGEYHVEIFLSAFIHYVAGTNWVQREQDFHTRKTAFMSEWLNRLIDGKTELKVMWPHHHT